MVETTHALYLGFFADLDAAADLADRLGYSEVALVRRADGTVRGESKSPPRSAREGCPEKDEVEGKVPRG